MLTPSPEIIQLLNVFACGMTAPTFKNALVLIYGTILAPGNRTVTAALRMMGINDGTFPKYHRVLSRAKWSPMLMCHLLLGLILKFFPSDGYSLTIVVDETLERRGGKKLRYKGWYRDAVRSNGNKVVTTQGIRWLCFMALATVPWSKRLWALPFCVVPVLSRKVSEKLNKPYRGSICWTVHVLTLIRRWFPEYKVRIVGDGGFSSVKLAANCQKLDVMLISRLRLDVCLYDFPKEQRSDKRGPKPKKGDAQRKLSEIAADPKTIWCCASMSWYGGGVKPVQYISGVSLWHTTSELPVSIRWVLMRYEETNSRTGKSVWKLGAFFSSSTEKEVTAELIQELFLGRWNIEVTFEEMRAHLGFETQRSWSQRSVDRTTPCLFGLFTLIVLMGKVLHPEKIPLLESAWYKKEEATFSDVLAAVRSHLWSKMNYTKSPKSGDMKLIPQELWLRVQQVVCSAN